MNFDSDPNFPLTGRLARALQAVLAVELAAFFAVGGWMSSAGYGAGAISAVVLGWFFGLRVAITGNSFRQSESNRSPRPPEQQLGAWGAWKLWWGEYWYTQLTYSVLFPFERWLVPLAPVAAAEGKGTPVVLVPGFACNRGYLVFMVRALRRAGLGPVYAVTLEPVFGGIDANATLLGQFVEQVRAATGAEKVHLVGHSMGGLVARAWIHDGNAGRVASVVTLGSPHHGTRIAIGVRRAGECLRQMCPGDAWLESLNRHELDPFPVPITSIVTPHDNIAFPQDTALLRYPNARNVVLVGEGHLQMVRSPRVLAALAAALRR